MMINTFIVISIALLSHNCFPDTLIRDNTIVKYKNYSQEEWIITQDLSFVKNSKQKIFSLDKSKKYSPNETFFPEEPLFDLLYEECISVLYKFSDKKDFVSYLNTRTSLSEKKYLPHFIITGKLSLGKDIETYILYLLDDKEKESKNDGYINRYIFLLTIKSNKVCSLINIAKCFGLFGSFSISNTEKINNHFLIKDFIKAGDILYSDEAWEELKKIGKPINEIKYSEFRINEDGYLEFVK